MRQINHKPDCFARPDNHLCWMTVWDYWQQYCYSRLSRLYDMASASDKPAVVDDQRSVALVQPARSLSEK
jgi:hypothetical protein